MVAPARILGIVSDPIANREQRRVSVGLDLSYIKQQVESTSYRDLIHIIPLLQPTLAEFEAELTATNPHVLHLACNGSHGGIFMRREQALGEDEFVPSDHLAALIERTPSIRVVVLNGSGTDEIAWELSERVDFVLNMGRESSVAAASAFVSSLYLGLASNRSVDMALAMGRDRVAFEGLSMSGIEERVRDPEVAKIPFIDLLLQEANQGRTTTLELVPPDGMWPENNYEYRVLEVCEGMSWVGDEAILNNPVLFERSGDHLVARVINARLGLQYKCMVDLPPGAPSDDDLTGAFEQVGWGPPEPDGMFEHANRRWFLILDEEPRCSTPEGYINNFLPPVLQRGAHAALHAGNAFLGGF